MTYLAIIEGRARFDGASTLKTWLFAVIRNVASSRWRRTRHALAALARLASFADAEESDAVAESLGRENDRLASAWKSLPDRQREVLDLVFYRGLAIAEAATVLGIGVGSARTHYERGKAALRRQLADLDSR